MQLDKWKQNKSLVRWWASVLATDEGKAFMEMMEHSHIRHVHGRGLDAGVELGQIQGYDIAMNNLECAGIEPNKPADLPEPTYEAPELESAPATRPRKRV